MENTIGFIGLGNMGAGMARNLVSSGCSVIGFDLDYEKHNALVADGYKKAENINEITNNCEKVILCLPHPDATQHVIFDGLLVKDTFVKTIIETSTLTPEIVVDLSEKLAAMNTKFLSAPMIGGKNSAINKTIQFLVEGEPSLYDETLYLFKAMGKQAAYVGRAPSATLAKLAFNLSRYANLAAGIEIYRLLQAYGANKEAIYTFMSEQSLDNFGQVWKEDLKDTMTEDTPFKPSQVPRKDLELLAKMADEHNLSKDLIKAIRNTYLSME